MTAVIEPIPASRCPLSGEVMSDPVVTSDGHSYSRSAITALLDEQVCPTHARHVFGARAQPRRVSFVVAALTSAALRGWSSSCFAHLAARCTRDAASSGNEDGRIILRNDSEEEQK